MSKAVSVSEMRPALPTAPSKVTPSDSHRPTIGRGPPTEVISDSSSTSVPSSSTHLLASSLTTASRTMGESGGGELIITGHSNIRECPGAVHTTTTLAFHNNSNFLLPFIRHDERRGFQLVHGGWIILFNKYHNYLNSSLTDLSASNDVSTIFQRFPAEKNSNFSHS